MIIASVALAWHRSGFVAVPVRSDGSKAPGLANWTEYQTRLPNQTELRNWWLSPDRQGFGLIMGAVSGNAEMLEFEGRFMHRLAEVQERVSGRNIHETFDKLWTGYRELTPSGGIHLVFRVSDGPALGNTKLASRPATPEELEINPAQKVKGLIETRGEGGFTVTAPSNGTTHPDGGQWTLQAGVAGIVPVITCAERDALYEVMRSFDECAQTNRPDSLPHTTGPKDIFSASTQTSPLDHFNSDANWGDILVPQGWVHDHVDKDGVAYWIRPGKDTPGVSATTGRSDTGDRLYVFSSSTPFEPETPMSKAFVWAHYQTGGDLKAAAAKLYEDGWGDRKRTQIEGSVDRPWFLPESFWEARPVFDHLRRAAWSQLESPEGVLVSAICLTLYHVEPNVVLSAPVGSEASLNLMAVLCGNPSDGKSVCRKIARDALDFGGLAKVLYYFTPGSGQGISKQYQHLNKKLGEMIQDRTSAFAMVNESEGLASTARQNASTIKSELCKAAMGEELGAGNVGETQTNLPEETYRFVMLMCMQPELAGWLLDGTSGGLPQRFLWTSVRDPRIVDGIDRPDPMRIYLPLEAVADPVTDMPRARYVIRGSERIWNEIRDARRQRKSLSDDEVSLDGHSILTRRKVSAALAIMDGRIEDTDEDWDLAEMIIEMSDAARDWVQSRVAAAAARENEQRAKSQGRADHIRSATVSELDVTAEESLQERVVAKLGETGMISLRDLGRRLHVRASDLNPVAEAMVDQGLIELVEEPTGATGRTRTMCKLVNSDGA